MLIEFHVENHRSIQAEQTLSFEAAGIDHPEGTTRVVPGFDKPLLHLAALYGANGSGKSNVLSALHFMCRAVAESQRFWAPNGAVPRDPFAWGDWRTKPSLFEVYVVLSGVRYRYGVVVDDKRVLEEWLFAWPKGHKQVWFEREGSDLKFGSKFRGERQVYQDVLRPNALLLSVMAQLNHEPTRSLYEWFATTGQLALNPADIRLATLVHALDSPDAPPDMAKALADFVRLADLGICGVEAREGPSGKEIWFQHGPSRDAWLPLEQQSRGTRALVELMVPLLVAGGTGALVIIDELDNNLHSGLARGLMHMSSLMTGQLLFSTHDATMLGTAVDEHPLTRDQVWLTEKSADGATTIAPLTDFKPRKSENLERGYLQGRYGGVPRVDDLERALRPDDA